MVGVSDSEDGAPDNVLPPGVTTEDVDLFKLAQDRAQDLLTKVSLHVFLVVVKRVLLSSHFKLKKLLHSYQHQKASRFVNVCHN